MNPSHQELDWPGVLRLAGRFCATERGREAVLGAQPTPDPDEAARRLALTRDLIERRSLCPPIAVAGLDDAVPLLPRLGPKGRALPPEDLLDLFVLVERSEQARKSVPVEGLELPELSRLLAPLADLSALLGERDVIFEPDGRVKDTATARLAAVRAAIVRLRREVVRRLEELARAHGDVLSEGYVTEKSGRYCLPVRADRRDALAGIVHEKSGSGQTFFVEPLAVVEANNALAEALEEEREEVQRILLALTSRMSAHRADLQRAAELLTEVDAYQARAEMASRLDAVLPRRGRALELKAARHPLLDRRLAALREEVFGEDPAARHSDAVPLDISLPEGKRMVLLSGPNAGGKSVAMKSVGLLALLSQSGFFVPAAPGTTLPVFDRILVVAGDAQDLLGDLSSFAAAMTRTARVLASASPKSLVLLDELGSGTDPDEGAALAVAILTEDLERRGVTVATTHLTAVKEWAQERPEVLAAAMEYDETAGRPTFRVRPGATGRSRALAVAERSGMPRGVLSAARARLGDRWAAHDAALERLEREANAAAADARRAREAAEKAEARLAEVERERAQVRSEREKLREKGRAEVDRALEALREKVRRELDRMREELRTGRAVSRGALTTITQAARAQAEALLSPEEEPAAAGPVEVGDEVRVRSFRASGRLLSKDERSGQAEVEVRGKRMRVRLDDLGKTFGPAPPCLARTTAETAPFAAPPLELVLVGMRVHEVLPLIERAINDALLAGRKSLRIVHGFGTGRLGAAVREFLGEHPGVSKHRPGNQQEGGSAVTIAELDV